MAFCSNCGSRLPEGAAVCENCGSQIPQVQAPAGEEVQAPAEPVAETTAAEEVAAEAAPVEETVAEEAPAAEEVPATEEIPVVEESAAPAVTEPVVQQEEIQEPKKKKSKKGIIIAVVALVLVAAIVAGIFLIGGKKKPHNYTMYIKDNALYYTELGEVAPVKIADEVIEESDGFLSALVEKTGISGIFVSSYSKLLSDNKTLIYPKKVSADSSGVNLFYKDIVTEGAQEVKIDSDVSNLKISEDEKTILYTKSEDDYSKVYKYTFETKEKEKIVDKAVSVQISDDCSKILYINDDDSLYIYNTLAEGEKKEKVDSDVESVFYNNADFSVVRYLKDKTIYEKTAEGEKKKIASEVDSVVASYETGEFYYLKLEEESIPYSALFTDDMKEADKNVEDEDEYYDTHSWNDYKAWYIKNRAVVNRVDLRDAIKEQKIDKTLYSLHYVNGEDQKKIADNVSADQFDFTYSAASDKAVIVYNTINSDALAKLKISELDFGEASYNERTRKWEYSVPYVETWTKFRETVEANYFDAQMLQMAIGGEVTEIDEDRAWDVTVADDGSAVYFIDNIKLEEEEKPKDEDRDYDAEWSKEVYYFEDDVLYLNPHNWSESYDKSLEGDIVKISITEGVADAPDVIDSDVSLYGIRLENDNTSLTYFKNFDTEKNIGDYYLNGKEIAYDVKGATMTFVSPTEIYYITEYDTKNLVGELKKYDGEETTLIASDVYYYELSPAGDVLFISDYSVKNNHGSLYLAGKEENILIDYDVTAIVSMTEFGALNAYNRYYEVFENFEVDDE